MAHKNGRPAAQDTPRAKRDALLGARLVEALKARHFDAFYCATPDEARQRIFSLIPPADVVAWGGSMTMEELGVIDWVRQNRPVIDRDKAQSREEKLELMRRSLLCDTYLMGTNALTAQGELFNIDANGNRVAALTFGPKQVIVAVGMNKVMPTLEEAVSRARHTAATINAARFDGVRGCTKTGQCTDCKSPDSICCSLVCTRLCCVPGRIKVVLVGGDWGY
ncbi:MAG: lactate utilization protein [Paludibacteraceae bacterium]|nr:lactate utilization protein [Paludibacteraceae bacterium]